MIIVFDSVGKIRESATSQLAKGDSKVIGVHIIKLFFYSSFEYIQAYLSSQKILL